MIPSLTLRARFIVALDRPCPECPELAGVTLEHEFLHRNVDRLIRAGHRKHVIM